jgi:hypothetical protein
MLEETLEIIKERGKKEISFALLYTSLTKKKLTIYEIAEKCSVKEIEVLDWINGKDIEDNHVIKLAIAIKISYSEFISLVDIKQEVDIEDFTAASIKSRLDNKKKSDKITNLWNSISGYLDEKKQKKFNLVIKYLHKNFINSALNKKDHILFAIAPDEESIISSIDRYEDAASYEEQSDSYLKTCEEAISYLNNSEFYGIKSSYFEESESIPEHPVTLGSIKFLDNYIEIASLNLNQEQVANLKIIEYRLSDAILEEDGPEEIREDCVTLFDFSKYPTAFNSNLLSWLSESNAGGAIFNYIFNSILNQGLDDQVVNKFPFYTSKIMQTLHSVYVKEMTSLFKKGIIHLKSELHDYHSEYDEGYVFIPLGEIFEDLLNNVFIAESKKILLSESDIKDKHHKIIKKFSDEVPFFHILSKHEFIGNYKITLFPVIFYDNQSNPYHKSDAILDHKIFHVIFQENQLNLIFNSLGYNIIISENKKIPGLYYLEVSV